MARFCRVTLSTFQTLEVWPLFEPLKETLALLVVPLGHLRSESLTVPGDDKSGTSLVGPRTVLPLHLHLHFLSLTRISLGSRKLTFSFNFSKCPIPSTFHRP